MLHFIAKRPDNLLGLGENYVLDVIQRSANVLFVRGLVKFVPGS